MDETSNQGNQGSYSYKLFEGSKHRGLRAKKVYVFLYLYIHFTFFSLTPRCTYAIKCLKHVIATERCKNLSSTLPCYLTLIQYSHTRKQHSQITSTSLLIDVFVFHPLYNNPNIMSRYCTIITISKPIISCPVVIPEHAINSISAVSIVYYYSIRLIQYKSYQIMSYHIILYHTSYHKISYLFYNILMDVKLFFKSNFVKEAGLYLINILYHKI